MLADPEINIVVELIGRMEPARGLVMKAIAAGKHVATANKTLLAQHGTEMIMAAACEKGVTVTFEAAVGGASP